jgi:hypothetical protein
MNTQPPPRAGHGHPRWMMLLCAVCLVPLALVAVGAVAGGAAPGLGGLSLVGIPLAFLLCPLMMGGMMLLMGRGHDGHGGSTCHGQENGADSTPAPAPPPRR